MSNAFAEYFLTSLYSSMIRTRVVLDSQSSRLPACCSHKDTTCPPKTEKKVSGVSCLASPRRPPRLPCIKPRVPRGRRSCMIRPHKDVSSTTLLSRALLSRALLYSLAKNFRMLDSVAPSTSSDFGVASDPAEYKRV